MKIVFIGIHPDDVELGCGATAALAAKQGHEVTIVDLSSGDSSSNGTREERAREAEAAARILGVQKRINLGMPDTKIQSESTEQARKVIACLRDLRPELVFVPNRVDPHPDHASGGVLVERALYLSGVQGFEAGLEAWKPRTVAVYIGRVDFEPHFIIDVSKTHDVKMRAIKAHRSQFIFEEGRKHTPLNSPDFLPFLDARSSCFGHKIGATYGEPFRLLYPLGLDDFSLFGKKGE